MPRTNKPANGSADSQRSPRGTKKSNGSAEHFNDADEIARRAYEIYLRRGGEHGGDLDDWLEAERQLRPGPSDVTGPAAPKSKRRKASEETGL
jgi:hypothetical protein